MKVINVPLEQLIPYNNNSRTHSEQQILQIAASIKEFGFTNPVLIDNSNGIIAGHGRVAAARLLGIDKIPCIELPNLTKAQIKAYVIADNQIALNSGWDVNLLAIELEQLMEENFNLDLLGFDDKFINELLGDGETTKELENEEYCEIFNVIVKCQTEADQERVFNKMTAEGYECQIQSL